MKYQLVALAFLMVSTPLAFADISVQQDLTVGEQEFIDLLNSGIRNITYTVGIGITFFNVPEAYGETLTFDIPWENSSGSSGYINPENENEYIIIVQRLNVPMTIEDLEEFRDVLTPEEFEQATEDITGVAIVDVPVEEQTYVEKELERLIEDCHDENGCSYADRELLDVYRTLENTCQIGIEEGARIQTFREFDLPLDTPDTMFKAIDLGNYPALGDILKKIDECNMWNEYRAKYLAQYNDMVLDEFTGEELHHSNNASLEYTYPSEWKEPIDTLGEHNKSAQAICDHTLYTEQFKRQMECPPTVEYTNEFEAPPMKDYGQSQNYREYVKFLNGDESQQLHKNIVKAKENVNKYYGGQK